MKTSNLLPGSMSNTRYNWYPDKLEVQYYLPIHHCFGVCAQAEMAIYPNPSIPVVIVNFGGNRYFIIATVTQRYAPNELNPLRAYQDAKAACYDAKQMLLDKYADDIKDLLFQETFK